MNKQERAELEDKAIKLSKVIGHFMPRGPERFRAIKLLGAILHLQRHPTKDWRQVCFKEAQDIYDAWQLARGSISVQPKSKTAVYVGDKEKK